MANPIPGSLAPVTPMLARQQLRAVGSQRSLADEVDVRIGLMPDASSGRASEHAFLFASPRSVFAFLPLPFSFV